MVKQSPSIYNDEIADALPLEQWISIHEFAKLIKSGQASLANRGRKAQQKNLDNGGYSAMAGKNKKQTKEYIEQTKFLKNVGFI